MKSKNSSRRARVSKSRLLVPAVAAVTALLVSGCGSEAIDDAAVYSETTLLPVAAASGTPIKIGFISAEGGQVGQQLPDARAAAEAATQYVNNNLGGVAGRPIELIVCKEKEDPVSARDCANQLVAAGVSAVVTPASGQGEAIVPVVTAAGIPYVTSVGPTASEMTTDKSFVLSGGIPATFAGAAKFAAKRGYRQVLMFVVDAGTVVTGVKILADPAFQGAGVGLTIVGIPVATPDSTARVSAALGQNPDAVYIVGDSTLCTSVLGAMGALDATADKLVTSTCADQDVIEAAGPAVEGAYIFSTNDVTSNDPDTVTFRTVMAQYAPGTDIYGFAFSGYQPVLGLVRAMQSVPGDFTPDSVLHSLRAAKDVPIPLGSGLTFTCDGTQVFILPSVCGRGVIVSTVKNGKPSDAQVIE